MQFKPAVLACAVLVAALISGAEPPVLEPRVILQHEVGKDFWFSAPYVLVVKALSAEPQGPPREHAFDGTMRLQLIEFTAEVETVLKGDDPGRTIRFYFFAPAGIDGQRWLMDGRRYIVSLRKESGVLRSMSDVSQLALRVDSGRHEQAKVPAGLSITDMAAYILLSPGVDYDPVRFGASLPGAFADLDASQGYMASLLAELLTNPNRLLRDWACVSFTTAFGIQHSCLSSAVHDPDEGVRRAVEHALGKGLDPLTTRGVLEMDSALKNDPISLMPPHFAQFIIDRLVVFTLDRRPEVRRAACQRLAVMLPKEKIANCR